MEFEKYLEEWFKGETTEVGIYMAMAIAARELGYPEVGDLLEQIAMDEARHAAAAALIAGKVEIDEDALIEKMEEMIEGEKNAYETRMDEADHHSDELDDEVITMLKATAYDEKHHRKMLMAALEKLKG
ncbi:MAG: rubrerythrin family protein [Methanopyri archaeon]|nr:rubrerythrin family protein [Methanopyri archaeon]